MKPIIFLMGPTASGKTPLAVKIVQNFPCEIISVDSAMVYRGMDIGTAKPRANILQHAPHRLIDLLDPSQRYSAGQFRKDALHEIDHILAQGKIPLLVGGTMLYFRILQYGLAKLPHADASLRAKLRAQADAYGWESLHAELVRIDPIAAKRIHVRDSQRIQRALEVFSLTGKTISTWHSEEANVLSGFQLQLLALGSSNRTLLHERISRRFEEMLKEGLIDEVRVLYERGDLNADLPAIRSVGYRQVWAYLAGELTYDEMKSQAIAATRQMAKRQFTWLRSWPDLKWFESDAEDLFEQVADLIRMQIQ